MRSSRTVSTALLGLLIAAGAFAQDKPPVANSPPKSAADPRAGHWRPFVSAGVGALTLRSGFAAGTANAFDPDDSRLGANVGGGVMAFSGSWGFKADVRYFRAAGSSNSIPIASAPASTLPTVTATMPVSSANAQADAALSGLHFWRANVGLAIRW